jgi:hypothetical protein
MHAGLVQGDDLHLAGGKDASEHPRQRVKDVIAARGEHQPQVFAQFLVDERKIPAWPRRRVRLARSGQPRPTGTAVGKYAKEDGPRASTGLETGWGTTALLNHPPRAARLLRRGPHLAVTWSGTRRIPHLAYARHRGLELGFAGSDRRPEAIGCVSRLSRI